MNIAFLLMPKSRVTYLSAGMGFRQGMEKLRRCGYTSIPVVARDGRYLGCLTEGDCLWNLLGMGNLNARALDRVKVGDITTSRVPAVPVTATVREILPGLLDMTQKYVPVVDDRRIFVGIVTRRQALEVAGRSFPLEGGLFSVVGTAAFRSSPPEITPSPEDHRPR